MATLHADRKGNLCMVTFVSSINVPCPIT
jgi:hypothetical protein